MAYVTQMLLDNGIRPPKSGRRTYRVKHCPGLYLQLSHTSAAAWVLMYRVEGKQHQKRLGRLREVPRLEAAVARAREVQDRARVGVDPFAPAPEDPHTISFAAAVDRWFAEHVERNLRPKTEYGYKRIFDADILPRWGSRPLASITKGDVLVLLNDKAARRQRKRAGSNGGAAIQANRTLTRLKTFFSWCMSNDLITADPTAGVRKPARETSRDKVLSDDELRSFWAATEGNLVGERTNGVSWGALFRLLLLTAQRRGEVAGMRWSEIDLDSRVYEIPGARTKNRKPHTVHLSSLAIDVLSTIERDGDLLFSGNGRKPAWGFVRAKQRLDKAMGTTDWVTHDLRRTATTLMARIGVAPHIADRILNHQSGTISGVAKIYNQYEYLPERKAALEALARFIASLLGLGGDNVVALRR